MNIDDTCNDGAGVWRNRRLFMYATTAFCMAVVGYVLHYDMSGEVAETAVTMAFLTIMSTAGSYVFGATWDDHSARQLLATRGGAASRIGGVIAAPLREPETP